MEDYKESVSDKIKSKSIERLASRVEALVKVDKSIPGSIVGSVRKEAKRILKILIETVHCDNIKDSVDPEVLWLNRRYVELTDAIRRYLSCNMPIPVEWVEERNRLHKKIEEIEHAVFMEALARINTKNK